MLGGDAGFFENLAAYGFDRRLAILQAALRELPGAGDVAALTGEHLAAFVGDHGSNAGAEKAAGLHVERSRRAIVCQADVRCRTC